MRLTCTGCRHAWNADLSADQRLVMCPSCGSLVPVESLADGPRSREMVAVPFSLKGAEGRDVALESEPGDSEFHEVRGALLFLDLARFREVTEGMERDKVAEIVRLAKRIVRYSLVQFGGAEADRQRGFMIHFDRPVDAVAYALNVQETLAKSAGEVGVPLDAQIGIHVGTMSLRRCTADQVTAGARPLEIQGPIRATVEALANLAKGRQVLVSRAAFDEAMANSAGNKAIPHGTQWLRHGQGTLPAPSGEKLEICEVGRPGLAPLVAPGATKKPAAAERPDKASAGQTLMAGYQFGAQALEASLRRKATPSTSGSKIRAAATKDLSGRRIGPYVLESLKETHEGIGSYKARDTDLERDVVVKILPPTEATNAEKRTRFAREGLGALYLRHANLVAAFDVGHEGELHYICYEQVGGSSLAELVAAAGPLQSRVALGYVLQAARGLAFAHEQGIVHRDIRPHTLLLSPQGTVKVSGTSLAKVRAHALDKAAKRTGDDAPIFQAAMEANLTGANVSLGNPAFIAPEQARDAAGVDARADQYALGTTLHFLLTGRPPFEGRTVLEVMANRSRAPRAPLGAAVGEDVDRFLDRLLADNPADRFASMQEAIAELESLLGLRGARLSSSIERIKLPSTVATPLDVSAAPTEKHATRLTNAHAEFMGASWARLRTVALVGYWVLGILAGVASWFAFQSFQLTGAVVGFLVIAPVMNVVLGGLVGTDPLLLHLRRAALHMTRIGWLVTGTLVAAGLTFLALLGLLELWGGMAATAAVAALVYQLAVVLPLRFQRGPAVRAAQEELRQLRAEGHPEEELQEAVRQAGGHDWEEFFEAIFGYDDMVAARWRAADAKGQPPGRRHAPWRDPLVDWLADIEIKRRQQRQHRELAEAEALRLQSQGVDSQKATAQAREEALRLIQEEQQRYLSASSQTPAFGPGSWGTRPAPNYHMAGSRNPIKLVLRTACSALGTFVMFAYFLPTFAPRFGISIPPEVIFWLKVYRSWGMGGTYYALLIGSMVLKQAAFSRILQSLAIIGGAVLLLFTQPVVALVAQPQFNPQMAVFCGWSLIALGSGIVNRFARGGALGGLRGLLPF